MIPANLIEPSVPLRFISSLLNGSMAIVDCRLTMLSESPAATAFYSHLEENQQNILMKIITFIMHALGFNNNLILEKSEPDDLGWATA